MSKDRCVLLVFPHPKTIFGPAKERKRRINKRRHWQRQNNYTPLYPIYINKRSLGKREGERGGERMLTVMVKIIFQATTHRVLKRVYGCKRVLHCRWNIWFSLAWPRPVTHSAGLMQSVYPNVTLTIHLWRTPQQHRDPDKLSSKHYWMIYFHMPRGPVLTCLVTIVSKDVLPWGFYASDVDLASSRLEHMTKYFCTALFKNITHSTKYSCFQTFMLH